MPEDRLTCPSCRGRISTFRLETGRGSGVCCECTDSYDIRLRTGGASDQVRTIDLRCRRTGKRSFHIELEQPHRRRQLVIAGWLAMAALAVALVIATGLTVARAIERGPQPLDAQILSAPLGLYLLALLGRSLSLRERVTVRGSELSWERVSLGSDGWSLAIGDVASTSLVAAGDDHRGICVRNCDGVEHYIGDAVAADDAALEWVWQRLRGELHGTSEIRIGTATANADQSHQHIWLY